MNLADRAAQIASRARRDEPAKPDELTPEQQRKLHAAADRSRPVATWYRLTRDGLTIDVAFNPELTLQEAQERYPFDTVQHATP